VKIRDSTRGWSMRSLPARLEASIAEWNNVRSWHLADEIGIAPFRPFLTQIGHRLLSGFLAPALVVGDYVDALHLPLGEMLQ
jgi:hypothetical protein